MAGANVSVDHALAMDELVSAWMESANRKSNLDILIADKIQRILSGSITFRYILITGILAKIVNTSVHPRALQKGSKLQGAYDARSLCHEVVVPFEHSKGDLWGASNEPFVNKPARHPEHDKNNPQLKDKSGATLTHDVLEWARGATAKELRESLIFIMQSGRSRLSARPQAIVLSERSLEPLRNFLIEFLSEPDGGTRLVAVMGAFVSLFNPSCEVKVYPPNASDTFAHTAGDIELYDGGELVSAYECKDRPFTTTDVPHGLNKARLNKVSEYVFVSGFSSNKPQNDLNEEGKKYGIDVNWIDIGNIINDWTLALNPKKRGKFGAIVIQNLTTMRRNEVAKTAEEIWNRLISKN